MALSFPRGFPQRFLAEVAVAEAAAERQFLSGKPARLSDRHELRKAARGYVMTLVLTFADQACSATEAVVFSNSEIGSFVEDFERRACVHAYHHLHLDTLWTGGWESLRDEVVRELHQSPGWLKYLERRDHPGPTAHVRVPHRWTEIEIRFTSDHRLQLTTPFNTETGNYAEMGFTDRRSEKPTKAWETFRDLATRSGILEIDRSVAGYEKQAKRIQEIRRILRARFSISDDPLPLIEDAYRAQFNIRCDSAFDS